LKAIKLASFLAFAIMLSLMGFLYSRENLFRLSTVETINGSPELREQIETKLLPLYGRPLFSLSLAGLESSIVRIPEVESVRIMRIWPDKLVVDVVEKEPVALEFREGKLHFVSHDNSSIGVLDRPISRPLLVGFEGASIDLRREVLEWLRKEQTSEFQSTLEMGIWDLTTLTLLSSREGLSLKFSELDLEIEISLSQFSEKWNRVLSSYHALRARNILATKMSIIRPNRVFIYRSRELQKSESGINLKELVRRTRNEKPQVR